MNTEELIKASIMDAKDRKKQWLRYALTCPADELDTVFGITEALALVEARGQELYIRSARQSAETTVDK